MKELIWLIPLLPFIGALLNGVVLRGRLSKNLVAWVACGTVGLSCILGVGAISSYVSAEFRAHEEAGGDDEITFRPFEKDLYLWIPAGAVENPGEEPGEVSLAQFSVSMGFLLDPLAAVMLFVVTFVGFLIHVYSVGYMGHEEGFQRYFTYLNLFMGAMLLLILGNNYLVLFVGWEGVGLCSYLLIGFYYDQDFPPYAGRKAFIVNRIGDFAFLVGLFALVSHFGTLNFSELQGRVLQNVEMAEGTYILGMSLVGFITLCLFVGAVGKSAQIPLYVWLPDAMAGPTPVSALIHAATMVTAGVYMVVRSNFLFQLAPGTSQLVAVVGCATALFAATIGLAQTDIKKVLAYSTVSQLGYMFLAAGVGAYTAAIFHLGTHAFFKALLFLGSGSVIHAMGGEQDMRQMGGLRKPLSVTFWTFLVGTVAISGVPPLAGFFSKDAILAGAWDANKVLWLVGLITAGLTACYMFRALFLTFFGEFRGTDEQRHHLHESPYSMTVPLVVLALGSIGAGFLGKWPFVHFDFLGGWLDHIIAPIAHGEEHAAHHGLGLEFALVGASIAAAAVGIFLAWRFYGGQIALEGGKRWAQRFPRLHHVLVNKYFVDEGYDRSIVRGTWGLARQLFRFDASFIDGLLVMGSRHLTVAISLMSGFMDKYLVDALVNFVGWILQVFSRGFRKLQTGLVSQYAMVVAIGVLALVCMMVFFR